MKYIKKSLLVGSVLMVLLVCAFAVSSSVGLRSDRYDKVDISYVGANQIDQFVKLYVDYESYGGSFEIARDITVATDRQFKNILPLESCSLEEDQYVYSFDCSENVDTLYIKPPILYLPADIDKITLDLDSSNELSSTSDIVANELSVGERSNIDSWFSISSISVSECENGNYAVNISIIPNNNVMPRNPKLIIDGNKVGGLSSLNINENNEFDFGEFIFLLSAESEDDVYKMLENADLMIEEALIRVEATDAVFSTDVRTINIVAE